MRFFKFQPINKYSLHGLANQSLFFAHPSVLNDPFEFELHDEVCSDEMLQYIRSSGGVGSEISSVELRSNLKKEARRHIADFGVVSLSERDDSPLMWGHYANDHKGMCLEFEVANHEGSVIPVDYSDELAVLTDPKVPFWHKDNALKPLTTKHSDWSYEKEHRLLHCSGGTSQPYPEDIELVSVAFGTRAPKIDIELVQHVLAGKRVGFRQAILNTERPKISFRSLDASKS